MSRLFALEGSTDEARGALALDLKVQAPLVLSFWTRRTPSSDSSPGNKAGATGFPGVVIVGGEGLGAS